MPPQTTEEGRFVTGVCSIARERIETQEGTTEFDAT